MTIEDGTVLVFPTEGHPIEQAQVAAFIGYRHRTGATNVEIAHDIGMSDSRVSELDLYDIPVLSVQSRRSITERLMGAYPDGIPTLEHHRTVARSAEDDRRRAFGPGQAPTPRQPRGRPIVAAPPSVESAFRGVEGMEEEDYKLCQSPAEYEVFIERILTKCQEHSRVLAANAGRVASLQDSIRGLGEQNGRQQDTIQELQGRVARLQKEVEEAGVSIDMLQSQLEVKQSWENRVRGALDGFHLLLLEVRVDQQAALGWASSEANQVAKQPHTASREWPRDALDMG